MGVQARASLAEGISEEVVNAINEGRAPDLADTMDRIVYDVAAALAEHGAIPDDLFAEAEQALGFNQLIDLVATTGYYAAVAMWVSHPLTTRFSLIGRPTGISRIGPKEA